MHITNRFLAALAITAVVAVMAATPTLAQCGMPGMGGMMGGGHDHSAMSGHAKPTAGEKKLRKSIDQVLSDEQGRAMLAEALLNDRAFVQALVRQMVAIPEWRDLVGREMASASGAAAPAPKPDAAAVVFACPMHPDVTSPVEADCPKCGMKLQRRAADGR